MSDGIRVVLFDMDGTLLDSREALLGAYRDATTEVLGAPYPVARSDADRIIQLSARQVFPELARRDAARAADIEAAFHRSYRARADDLRLYPGVAELLDALRRAGLALGIVTSKSRVRLRRDLEHNAIADRFAVTVCGDEVTRPKPDPEPIALALAGLGVAAADALFVGDGANDVAAARAAGVRVCGAGYGFHPDDCRAAGPEHWIDAPGELAAIVRSLRGAAA